MILSHDPSQAVTPDLIRGPEFLNTAWIPVATGMTTKGQNDDREDNICEAIRYCDNV